MKSRGKMGGDPENTETLVKIMFRIDG
jgi:hypothetical protein